MKNLLLIISILVFTLKVSAQEIDIEAKTQKCLEIDYSTAGQRKCMFEAQKDWDTELNKYYKLLLNKLPEKAVKTLIDAQRNWIKFRDAEFLYINEYYFGVKQGTMFHIVAEEKRKEIIEARANELKEYYNTLDY